MNAVEGWRQNAACKEMDPNIFFPDIEVEGSSHRAKTGCALCLVQDECLDYAIATQQTDGIWGGLNSKQRDSLRRRRQEAASRAVGVDAMSARKVLDQSASVVFT